MKILSSKLVIIPAFLIKIAFSADVTFQVDMQDVESTDNGVYLVGDWDYTFHEMSNINGHLYPYTYSFSTSGVDHEYWFVIDDDFSNSD